MTGSLRLLLGCLTAVGIVFLFVWGAVRFHDADKATQREVERTKQVRYEVCAGLEASDRIVCVEGFK